MGDDAQKRNVELKWHASVRRATTIARQSPEWSYTTGIAPAAETCSTASRATGVDRVARLPRNAARRRRIVSAFRLSRLGIQNGAR
jgi:hypothetical protein